MTRGFNLLSGMMFSSGRCFFLIEFYLLRFNFVLYHLPGYYHLTMSSGGLFPSAVINRQEDTTLLFLLYLVSYFSESMHIKRGSFIYIPWLDSPGTLFSVIFYEDDMFSLFLSICVMLTVPRKNVHLQTISGCFKHVERVWGYCIV